MKKTHIMSLSLLPISLLLVSCEQDTPTTISTISVSNPSFSIIENKDRFDMNDRFSGSGATGEGRAEVEDFELELRIRANDLEANHPYEVHVIVGPEGNPDLDLANLSAVFIFPVTSDEDGEFRFRKDIDLVLDPGQYRFDYLVLHDLAAHGHDQDTFPTFLVLACQPASFFTLAADDD